MNEVEAKLQLAQWIEKGLKAKQVEEDPDTRFSSPVAEHGEKNFQCDVLSLGLIGKCGWPGRAYDLYTKKTKYTPVGKTTEVIAELLEISVELAMRLDKEHEGGKTAAQLVQILRHEAIMAGASVKPE